MRCSWRTTPAAWCGCRGRTGEPRPLPAGRYTLVGYRILADDAEGDPWHVSATGGSIREVVVESGVNRDLGIDASIRIATRVHAGRIQVSVQGEHGAGLSIYEEGRRIPIGYRLLDASGTELASGRIEYG